ncbi:MAG TPA: glycosyltransferase [Egibacteraceae bacterium]|nr:glycosyltransferase [Egibacteraceae bacterium]
MRALALTHVFPRHVDDPSAPFLLTWARALVEAGADVAVIAPHDAGLPRRRTVDGVPVRFVRYAPDRLEGLAYRGEMHRLALRPAGPPLVAALLRALARALRAQVRAGSPDVVHVHWWLPGAVATRLARVDVPVVCTVHGTDVGLVESRPRLAGLARWALAGADRVEAVSSDLAERLERAVGRAPDAVNPMPADPAWFPAQPAPSPAGRDDRLRVLAVGRMVPEKGFADLVSAVALLEAPARLILVGDGPERPRLEAHAAALGVAAELPGRLAPPALRRAYAAADVVVQASHREGFGLVAAEALLAGTPVVATDSGGTREVLPAGDLVAVGDVPALAARLAAVAADPAAARRAARQAGRRLRARLAPEAAAERTLAGWRAVTGR